MTLLIFGVSQLVVNSVLTPLGVKLQTLNTEKEHLVEENRQISEEIAKNSSIKVIENLSDKKLNLTQEKQQTVVYIEDTTLVANRSNE
ncbi:hypothetical protein CVU76_02690 [Candidatus Dojkabacteria bacterium HGW-Dojkabacteria-1]|uniref:Cell division protein FtsL n=1 Tax=Candidatus Dojkabacteria bacterium HGW-Dojkabacteria-1 TaxID=2013761 RepID=A0A2N2F418_9BACT|nr:MAG: hypothetical protein CVU76_02690 [Candidatus Dojkabacteria bacterium HGW-Dojkabacteria-1]